jgi:amino acid adenylation domain-containing protein
MFEPESRPRSAGSDQQPVEGVSAKNMSAHSCVPALVTEQALKTPNATALAAGAEVVTYSELDRRSNQVANFLVSLGAGFQSLVGIWRPRSTSLFVTALGVLKAGAAYIPFDPSAPARRIADMLEESKPAALFTTARMAEQLPKGPWQSVVIDDDSTQIANFSEQSINKTPSPDDRAYVIFTSGSTGRPKGVEVSHAGLRNLIDWHVAAFEVQSSDRGSQLANPGFDAAVWEVWPYLTAGASVHLVEETLRNEPELLRDWIVAQQITICFVPPHLAERMINLEWPKSSVLRILLTGADTLRSYPPPGLPFSLVNNYGPTECTVVSTSGVVPPQGTAGTLPSIGRPISNVSVYILDEAMTEVPSGGVGEIHVGGRNLAIGYLNAPEMTASKFIAKSFEDGSSRLYRTGDLGCYLPNGEVAFRGRIDQQVKIRGYRIELEEIISALSKYPGVEAATVVARENTSGEKQLIAYITHKSGEGPGQSALRDFLSRQLPDYMIPSVFVEMDSLPFNASGKVDLAALPVPEASPDAYVAPRNPVERRIAVILAPLLGVEEVSVEDNFFMLGGHSLLGTQLIARLRSTFGVEVTLRSLFESPTVAALAGQVERLLYERLKAMSDEEAAALLNNRLSLSEGA